MYIGEVSKRTGATPKAIRLYETLGLIPAPKREGVYRVFDEQDIELIQIIKYAQRIGFSLGEMKAMLQSQPSCASFPWDAAAHLVQAKAVALSCEIERLELQKQALTELASLLGQRKCE